MKKALESQSRSDAAVRAWLGVVRAYNLCDVQLGQRLAELGLRMAEHELLVNIHLQPGITQQELSARCFVAKSGVSVTLGRMEEQRWLRRESDASDGRVKRMFLTAAGTKLAAQSLALQNEIITTMMAPLSEAELVQMQAASERIARQLEERD